MKNLVHLALVSLLPCAALAQSPAHSPAPPPVLQSPSGGWTYKGLSDDATKITYAYPNNLIDRGGQRNRTLIEGHLKKAGKTRGTPVLVANGNPMPLYTDEQGRFARPYAFGPGSNGIEVRDSEGRSIKRVQFYEANKLAAKAGVRIILAWDDPQAELGPVNTKDASANAVIGAQSKARGAAKAIRLGETCNAALRPNGHVPEGLFPKRPCAALQSLAGDLPRLRFAPCSRPFEEQRIWHL